MPTVPATLYREPLGTGYGGDPSDGTLGSDLVEQTTTEDECESESSGHTDQTDGGGVPDPAKESLGMVDDTAGGTLDVDDAHLTTSTQSLLELKPVDTGIVAEGHATVAVGNLLVLTALGADGLEVDTGVGFGHGGTHGLAIREHQDTTSVVDDLGTGLGVHLLVGIDQELHHALVTVAGMTELVDQIRR